MKFSQESEFFIDKVIKNVQLKENDISKESELVYKNSINSLIDDLAKGHNYARYLVNKNLIKIDVKKITIVQEIPKPYGFNSHYFPKHIRKAIEESASYHIKFDFKINKRSITIHFICLNEESSLKMIKYKQYIHFVIVWFYIASLHASNECSKHLNVYLYMTDFKKFLPENNITIINENNINSGLSDVCRRQGEIIIYRKEEWFKVLIHETFHNYGLDFAIMDIKILQSKIKHLFPIKSKMAVYECYTELWAEIINCLFCSYVLDGIETINKENLFLYFNFVIEFEKIFSLFQMVKMLNFMGLTYTDILHFTNPEKRNFLYKENTHVFPYFILKTILLNNYKSFIVWCFNSNINLIRFTQNKKTLLSFSDLIKKNYTSQTLLSNIKIIEKYISAIDKKEKKLILTARMSLCELI